MAHIPPNSSLLLKRGPTSEPYGNEPMAKRSRTGNEEPQGNEAGLSSQGGRDRLTLRQASASPDVSFEQMRERFNNFPTDHNPATAVHDPIHPTLAPIPSDEKIALDKFKGKILKDIAATPDRFYPGFKDAVSKASTDDDWKRLVYRPKTFKC
jgi:hypothetical protein